MSNSKPSDFWEAIILLTCQRTNFFVFYYHGWRDLMSSFTCPEALDNWLLETGQTMENIPCPESCHCHDCGSMSIRQDGDRYIAECPYEKFQGRTFSEKEVSVQEYDIARLHEELVKCIPGTIAIRRAPTSAFTWQIGQMFRGVDKETRKIFISYLEPPQLWSVIPFLVASEKRAPVFLLTPFVSEIPERECLAYHSMNIELIPLQKYFSINRLNGYPSMTKLPPPFADFLAWEDLKILRKSIPVPAFTRWSDIHIIFQDQFTVSCYLNGKNYTRTYMDFGLVNNRTGAPSLLWWLLVNFSTNKGHLQISWPNKRKAASDQQKKHRLDMVLREYFKIASPAITFSHDHTEYQCNFVIADESHSTTFHRKQR